MEPLSTIDSKWIFGLLAINGSTLHLLLAVFLTFLLTYFLTPGGPAWANGRSHLGTIPIPGPRGLPVLGSLLTLTGPTPHRTLAALAASLSATDLMAISVGSSPTAITSNPTIAREILHHPSFSDRPTTQARQLMFSRAIGFAPSGAYWRLLRRIASTHLFSPRRVAAHEPSHHAECQAMIHSIETEQQENGSVVLRRHLKAAALNSIMKSVFGQRYDVYNGDKEGVELMEMVEEGFELLGAFNLSDHLPWLARVYDPLNVKERCEALNFRVRRLVKGVIEERKRNGAAVEGDGGAFVDVLLGLQGDEKMEEDDMVAVLWEMIFRGVDTTALLAEWSLAELVRHPEIQHCLHASLSTSTSHGYLTATLKETLRHHPPGPLLSWARISTSPVRLSNNMVIPENTTAMVNMWAIAHDETIWACPDKFMPERFMAEDVDVRGGDMRLAPFGAGRRVCPGRGMGMAMVEMWVKKLVEEFEWVGVEVEMEEVLKLSCEMKTPLKVVAVRRGGGAAAAGMDVAA